jgi:secondary thiamine-phosphate synthase enzyme
MKRIEITLPAFSRGFHLITDLIEKQLNSMTTKDGILNIFIRHTSAALTINENADPSVRTDFEAIMNKLIPENQSYYTHIYEGSDDMPAHVKASLFSTSLSIPVQNGRLHMGTWQGIYLCEFRNYGGNRKLTLTLIE